MPPLALLPPCAFVLPRVPRVVLVVPFAFVGPYACLMVAVHRKAAEEQRARLTKGWPQGGCPKKLGSEEENVGRSETFVRSEKVGLSELLKD